MAARPAAERPTYISLFAGVGGESIDVGVSIE